MTRFLSIKPCVLKLTYANTTKPASALNHCTKSLHCFDRKTSFFTILLSTQWVLNRLNNVQISSLVKIVWVHVPENSMQGFREHVELKRLCNEHTVSLSHNVRSMWYKVASLQGQKMVYHHKEGKMFSNLTKRTC